MLVSQSRTVAWDIITVLETQLYPQSHLGQEYPELGEDDMEELARGIIMGEVLWVCQSTDRTLPKLVAIYITKEIIYLA